MNGAKNKLDTEKSREGERKEERIRFISKQYTLRFIIAHKRGILITILALGITCHSWANKQRFS